MLKCSYGHKFPHCLLVQKYQRFFWMGEFSLMVELHWKGFDIDGATCFAICHGWSECWTEVANKASCSKKNAITISTTLERKNYHYKKEEKKTQLMFETKILFCVIIFFKYILEISIIPFLHTFIISKTFKYTEFLF